MEYEEFPEFAGVVAGFAGAAVFDGAAVFGAAVFAEVAGVGTEAVESERSA